MSKTREQIRSEYMRFGTIELAAECQSLKREIGILRDGVKQAHFYGKYKRRDNLRVKMDKARVRYKVAKDELKSRQMTLF